MGTFFLKIITLESRIIYINVNKHMTFDNIKDILEIKLNIPKNLFYLFFRNRCVNKNETLIDNKITNKSTIYLLIYRNDS